MKSNQLFSEALLLLAALIWGFAFVAQIVGMEHVGPYTFNLARFIMGGLALLPIVHVLSRRMPHPPVEIRVLPASLLAGTVLFIASSLQQIGLQYTTAGKAGFITGLYIVLIPFFGLFFRQHTHRYTWIGAGLALWGLYLLTIEGPFELSWGDTLELIGALFWAAHVMVIGWLAPRTDALRLAAGQFLVAGLLSGVAAFWVETPRVTDLLAGWAPILYGGLGSVAIAFTLQVIAQKHVPASHAAILMSLEAAFAALGGWLMLDETLSVRGLIGCALMLAGMVCSQLRPRTTVPVASETSAL
ncbi:DMT family transporter [Hahella sp. SMD15-11]|uniref:DMT family transporter n=1 Tax=Thermohahella caldifontis TaxID=3142973 RepID=A0AB39UTF3_9GAMM